MCLGCEANVTFEEIMKFRMPSFLLRLSFIFFFFRSRSPFSYRFWNAISVWSCIYTCNVELWGIIIALVFHTLLPSWKCRICLLLVVYYACTSFPLSFFSRSLALSLSLSLLSFFFSFLTSSLHNTALMLSTSSNANYNKRRHEMRSPHIMQ